MICRQRVGEPWPDLRPCDHGWDALTVCLIIYKNRQISWSSFCIAVLRLAESFSVPFLALKLQLNTIQMPDAGQSTMIFVSIIP